MTDKELLELAEELENLRAENATLKVERDEKDRQVASLYQRHEDLSKQLLAAQHRIKELREALESIANKIYDSWSNGAVAKEIAVAVLAATPDNTAEIDALVKDAERYRWLRIHSVQPAEPWSNHHRPESFDEAIDAAMKANHAP